jgi:Ca2+-binding RTX toxin-like protein
LVRPVARRRGSAIVTVNRLSDGQLTGSAHVTVRVAGNGRSSATGGDGPDVVFGQNGADTLGGMGGNDLLCGGNGADDLSRGATTTRSTAAAASTDLAEGRRRPVHSGNRPGPGNRLQSGGG